MNTSATCPADQPAPSAKPSSQDAILEIPLRWLTGHKPELFQTEAIPAEARNEKADIRVTDLWGQLSRGRVVTTYSRLMANIPAAFIRDEGALPSDELVDLPLNEIVGALGPAALEKMRPAGQVALVDDMPDLFQFDSPASVAKPVAKSVDEPVLSEATQAPDDPPDLSEFAAPQTMVAPPSPEPVAKPARLEAALAPDDPPDLSEFAAPQTMLSPPVLNMNEQRSASVAAFGAREPLLLQGVDVNSASIDELVAGVDALTHHLAHQIVYSRERDGLYLSSQDLARVSGIGPAVFHRLTGQAWPGTISRDRTAAIAVLGLAEEREIRFPSLVQRFREQKGFDGCVIVNGDGETIAESWGDSTSEALAAFVSHTMKRMTPHIRSMGVDGADFMTVSLNGRPFTMVQVHDLTFIAVHEAGRFSLRQVRFVQQVGLILRDVLSC